MTNWMHSLAGQSLGNFEATPELDRYLSRRALAARSDPSERNALYILLTAKIERFANRFRYWQLDPFTIDDVLQETFLIYTKTLEYWSPRYERGEPAGYLYYFLRVFPLWLSNAAGMCNHPKLSFGSDYTSRTRLPARPGLTDARVRSQPRRDLPNGVTHDTDRHRRLPHARRVSFCRRAGKGRDDS